MDTSNQASKERQDFKDLDVHQLEKYYFRSRNMNALGVFMWIIAVPSVFFVAIMIAGIIMGGYKKMDYESTLIFLFIIAYSILYVSTAYICLSRKNWGRIPGIVVFAIFLIGIPIGTIMGIYGIKAFEEKSLFGPNRYTHARLKAEYQFRKKNKVS